MLPKSRTTSIRKTILRLARSEVHRTIRKEKKTSDAKGFASDVFPKEAMRQIWNFSAGPAMLPHEVLEEVQSEFLDYHGLSYSIVETSHRTPEVEAIVASLTDRLRRLLRIPDDFEILYTQGGGRTQFAMIPANLLQGKTGAYLVTGAWSESALEEAERFGTAVAAARTCGKRLPEDDEIVLPADPAYLYYCDNETIHGVEFQKPPLSSRLDLNVPLVADASSNFLSHPIDWSRHVLVWAAAQKNFAPAGLTVVAVRRDALGHLAPHMPSMFDYALYAERESMPNTPPVFQLYVAERVAGWVEKEGGVEEMDRRACVRSALLYDALDARPDLYETRVAKTSRSRMNVAFFLRDESLMPAFVEAGRRAGFVHFTGHSSVGGLRVSLYNAMPIEGAERFADFLRAWRP